MRIIVCLLSLLLTGPLSESWAQLPAPNSSGVAMGHVHYRIPDMEGNKKFWIALGAKPAIWNKQEVLKLPGALVRLSKSEPKAGSEGSAVNHISLRVQNLKETLDKMKAAGYRVEPSRNQPESAGSAFTPEGDRVEIILDQANVAQFTADDPKFNSEAERHNRKLETPLAFHHIHVHVPKASVTAAKEWYVKMFGAVPGKRANAEAVALPGLNLTFQGVDQPVAPIKGRTFDHIGFEVKNLEAFCKKLEAKGLKFERPYEMRAEGVATAYFVDPWGVYVELTEGLRNF